MRAGWIALQSDSIVTCFYTSLPVTVFETIYSCCYGALMLMLNLGRSVHYRQYHHIRSRSDPLYAEHAAVSVCSVCGSQITPSPWPAVRLSCFRGTCSRSALVANCSGHIAATLLVQSQLSTWPAGYTLLSPVCLLTIKHSNKGCPPPPKLLL